MQSHINVGSGSDVTIAEVAKSVAQAVGYSGNIEFDSSKPDGAPRKWMDSSVIQALGWQPKVDIRQGLFATYQDFLNKL
jgi:GDP-L-fucose synthase